MLDTEFAYPRDDTDALMLKLLPGTNLVRLVMFHWCAGCNGLNLSCRGELQCVATRVSGRDDAPTETKGKTGNKNDCSETYGGRAISERCLQQFDRILRWTATHGLWAIITARGSLAAGEQVPGARQETVFSDTALRDRFIEAWRQVARRYRGFDLIAGWEVLSEPRIHDEARASTA